MNPNPNESTRPIERSNLGSIIHRYLTNSRHAVRVWQRFRALKSPDPAGFISYETFLARLENNGHGALSVSDLPVLMRAMSDTGLDPQPLIRVFLDQLTPPPDPADGDLSSELLSVMSELGKITQTAGDGNVNQLSGDDLRRIIYHTGRIAILARQLEHEALTGLHHGA